MKHLFIALAAIVIGIPAYSQNRFVAVIRDDRTKETVAGVTVHIAGSSIGNISDANGVVILTGIASGRHAIIYEAHSHKPRIDSVDFPVALDTIAVAMAPREDEELEVVVVASTRSSRSIADIPTRIEIINGEELEEKANMKPGDIRMLLAESTGIQTQQTSATSGNSSIRIQGLDGRYTQLLKDGFPLYSGAASGLGLLQIPPLDLKQVEIIKGASSTLYGGGAIAGMVNLISKTPGSVKELRFLVNGTSAGGLDLSGYYGKRAGRVGVTVLASRNSSRPYDPAGIGLTAIPQFERYTVNPKLFLYLTNKLTAVIGANGTIEDREGGNIRYIRGQQDSDSSYFERNKTQRLSTELSVDYWHNNHSHFSFKNSYSYFQRTILLPGYEFHGWQQNTFSELNYSTYTDKVEWVGGLNLWTENFKESDVVVVPPRNYIQNTVGAFIQNIWQPLERWTIETGLRADYVSNYGMAVLPRVSILFNATSRLTSRLGGGFGYKAPTIFTEESERLDYRNVFGVSPDSNKMERSYGANWDVNYRTTLFSDRVSLSMNYLLYYTYLNSPLILEAIPGGLFRFRNINGYINTRGTEANIIFGFRDFKMFLGYTYTDANTYQDLVKEKNLLTPEHRVNAVLVYEQEGKWKLGLEAYYFSPQLLSDGTTGQDYWIMGFMAERIWDKFSLFVNFENYLDTRQTRFGTIYTGTLSNPQFKDIYAPLDGFVINGGVKLRL
jgi:iron complex outermembrane receptor protein